MSDKNRDKEQRHPIENSSKNIDINSTLSIITLNIIGLNTIKRDCQNRQKIRCNSMLFTRMYLNYKTL